MTTEFEYHLKLHYSQTINHIVAQIGMFEYHLKLHYSQTEDYHRLHRP